LPSFCKKEAFIRLEDRRKRGREGFRLRRSDGIKDRSTAIVKRM
jgi:hypothetical protein